MAGSNLENVANDHASSKQFRFTASACSDKRRQAHAPSRGSSDVDSGDYDRTMSVRPDFDTLSVAILHHEKERRAGVAKLLSQQSRNSISEVYLEILPFCHQCLTNIVMNVEGELDIAPLRHSEGGHLEFHPWGQVSPFR